MVQARLAWTLLPYEELAGAANMAIDHALADALEVGEAALRFYGWTAPTISLGRNQPAVGGYDLARARELGVEFVRRPTGGRAVLHHRELTYSVVFPTRAFGGPREAYRAINRALVEGVRLLGVEASLAVPASPIARPTLRACFDGSVANEVVVEGRKLLGSAQARIGRAFLQHGSLLLLDDQSLLVALTPHGPMDAPPVTLAELLGEPPTPDVAASKLREGFEAVLGARFGAGPALGPEVEARVCELRAKYEDPAWTWRR